MRMRSAMVKRLKIVFMGTPDFAVGALQAIIEAGHQVSAVVTQPDKPKGRGKELQMTPVKACAAAHNIPVFQPGKIKEPEAVEVLRSYEADIFVVAAFGQILSEEILSMPKYGCVNIHASLLPKYRGAGPIQWAIIDGEKKTGVTIMQMEKGLDTGDMLLQKEVEIDPKETGDSLHDKLAAAGAELIVEALPKIAAGQLTPRKQNDAESCYAKMLQKSMGRIDWNLTADKLDCLIRGLISWPGASTTFRGKNLKIWEEEPVMEGDFSVSISESLPGTIVCVEKEAFYVQTKEGVLKVLSVQIEGKKRMAVKDFLLGYPIKAGECLGS
ncbi:MAG: methionyl-tRNA formyltransferase [Lachnospiraceae bacterium]|nr:methionyl-tRNA formyltransferase [Lachnospiraceae bacterium]